jgi:hypothetical protein
MKTSFNFLVLFLCSCFSVFAAETGNYDVVIYGGTCAAITTAVQVKKMGKTAVIVSPDKHLGGLSSGGLGFTDSGNTGSVGGLSREFYQRVYAEYKKSETWRWQKESEYVNVGQGTKAMRHDDKTMWIFEPHIAETVFDNWVKEMDIPVVRNAYLDRKNGVKKDGTKIVSITTLDGKTFTGKMFIDTTYEGDLTAAAGCSYFVGREGNEVYGEQNNGNQWNNPRRFHSFGKPVSPYKIPANPESGLLKYIGESEIGETGTGDRYVQAYNYRLCLTDNPDNRVPFQKPANYNPQDYELLARILESGWKDIFHKFDRIPNLKTDTNNHGPFSTDFIGGNYEYPDGSYEKRTQIIQTHRDYICGWLYFIANDPRVPEDIQKKMQKYGFAKDEFTDNGHFPHQLYVREARRLLGEYVMTEMDCKVQRRCPKPVGMGSYGLDSHNVRRYVTKDGAVQNEGDVEIPLHSPYAIDFGSLTPKRTECTNLLVPVCVSSTHIAFGSIRMEPVFMILGQSAATIAVLASERGINVQELDYEKLKERLVADGQRLEYTAPNINENGVSINSLKGIVIDNGNAKLTGEWLPSGAMPKFVGNDYLQDGNSEKGKLSAAFEIELPKEGLYEVRISYAPNPNRSKNVPVTVIHNEGKSVIKIDETKNPPLDGLFLSIGTFSFGKKAVVSLSNEGTTGYVIVDAVQLIAQ